MSAPGGVSGSGGLLWGGVCSRGGSGVWSGGWSLLLGGCLLPGGLSARGGGIPACTEADPLPLPVNRMNDRQV